ncbi:PAS-domain containing protein [Altererythrobacter sp. GH1-8]|uniref:PAS domain-containing sensor histidine kinase n=1 Tax=Altererythrobacter sp. GH1-8 TaxID=3349333 RepID=UPI00374DE299
MDVSPDLLAFIGLLLAAWTIGAAVLMMRAARTSRRVNAMRESLKRSQRMIDAAPAVPVLVRSDGRIEAGERLAAWLGLDRVPHYLSELHGEDGTGLGKAQVEQISEAVKASQQTAQPFRLVMTPPGSKRSLAVAGTRADPSIWPGGAALLWIFDFSDSERELAQLRETAHRAQHDFAALVGLIEAAPIPMWFRGRDTKLRLVNRAYVEAVGAEDAEQVIEKQIELLEPTDGMEPGQLAAQAAKAAVPEERIVPTTVSGERRSLRVSDLAVGREGIAGYAIDIEALEQLAREFRAFRDAQRAMLDQLSVGVAQFDAQTKLVFANLPFQRLFDLSGSALTERLPFDRFLADAHDKGRTPGVRDFPAWRSEHMQWFSQRETQEEYWTLGSGEHLRIVAQPMPDGGLVLIAEDQSEQLALSATRDTLLRTRTATLDSLFEAIAVFAPDGSLQLWNRSFGGTWGLEPELLDSHPSVEDLLAAIKPNLARPEQAQAIGEIIRTATLERQEKGGRIDLADNRTLEFAGVPLPDGNGLLTVLDITDSQKAERALRERAQALEDADAMKSRFLANMSYEFRTPLTSIGGFAELIESGAAGPVSDQMAEYLAAILDSVARLSEQVENVLDLSQSEAGLLPLKLEETDLLDLLTSLVRDREKDILGAKLRLDLRGDPGVMAEVDPRQLKRAVNHLLDNSIKSTKAGGKILIDLASVDEGKRIVVSDNGSGMTRSELRDVVQGNHSGSDDLPERRKGLGIALATRLVEAHGGTLTIESQKGVGTAALIVLK